jgi:hypothetical protein
MLKVFMAAAVLGALSAVKEMQRFSKKGILERKNGKLLENCFLRESSNK